MLSRTFQDCIFASIKATIYVEESERSPGVFLVAHAAHFTEWQRYVVCFYIILDLWCYVIYSNFENDCCLFFKKPKHRDVKYEYHWNIIRIICCVINYRWCKRSFKFARYYIYYHFCFTLSRNVVAVVFEKPQQPFRKCSPSPKYIGQPSRF